MAGNRLLALSTGVEDSMPDEFGLDGLEGNLDHGVVVARRGSPWNSVGCRAPNDE
ncbi:hypothetical protein ACWGNZ_10315 [Sphingomonas zeae]|jgi:hypothetical protein